MDKYKQFEKDLDYSTSKKDNGIISREAMKGKEAKMRGIFGR